VHRTKFSSAACQIRQAGKDASPAVDPANQPAALQLPTGVDSTEAPRSFGQLLPRGPISCLCISLVPSMRNQIPSPSLFQLVNISTTSRLPSFLTVSPLLAAQLSLNSLAMHLQDP
jgi:hypothetical protein